MIDGNLVMGAQGYAGEIGHMRVNPRGRACRCGAIGCWETEIGEPAVRLATGSPAGMPVVEIVARAAAGDKAAAKGLRTVGAWLGVGVANLVNILNPDVVVFGGTLREILPATRDAVTEAVSGALTAPGEHVLLALPALGDDSTLLGAAESAAGIRAPPPRAVRRHRAAPPGRAQRRHRAPGQRSAPAAGRNR